MRKSLSAGSAGGRRTRTTRRWVFGMPWAVIVPLPSRDSLVGSASSVGWSPGSGKRLRLRAGRADAEHPPRPWRRGGCSAYNRLAAVSAVAGVGADPRRSAADGVRYVRALEPDVAQLTVAHGVQ